MHGGVACSTMEYYRILNVPQGEKEDHVQKGTLGGDMLVPRVTLNQDTEKAIQKKGSVQSPGSNGNPTKPDF